MDINLSTSLEVVGRSAQFQRIVEVLAQDGDLLITGVPGCGRRTLGRQAALEIGARALEVDCIRATEGRRFVELLAEAISQNFESLLVQTWVNTIGNQFFGLESEKNTSIKLLRFDPKQLWQAFTLLIQLPQLLAEAADTRVVLILHSFPHIRAWDRNHEWEDTLRREIKWQTRVSYVLIATIAETINRTEEQNPLAVIELAPLTDEVLAVWAREILHTQKLTFDSRSPAVEIFVRAVQGHIGDAMALIRRLVALHRSDRVIREQQVQQAIQELLQDLSITFESLLMLLPASQVQLLESLALDPTNKPQSKRYIEKHRLARGGSLQGALSGLQHKGLIYGDEHHYRLALPLFALWLRQRLS